MLWKVHLLLSFIDEKVYEGRGTRGANMTWPPPKENVSFVYSDHNLRNTDFNTPSYSCFKYCQHSLRFEKFYLLSPCC